jgi:hypothetical protein
MQKMIHGADDLITSSESSMKEQPPVLEHDIGEALADSDGDSESESNMTTGALHKSHDGLYSSTKPC